MSKENEAERLATPYSYFNLNSLIPSITYKRFSWHHKLA